MTGAAPPGGTLALYSVNPSEFDKSRAMSRLKVPVAIQAEPASPPSGAYVPAPPRSPKPFPGVLPGYTPPSWHRSSLGQPGGVALADSGRPQSTSGSASVGLPGSIAITNSVVARPLRRADSASLTNLGAPGLSATAPTSPSMPTRGAHVQGPPSPRASSGRASATPSPFLAAPSASPRHMSASLSQYLGPAASQHPHTGLPWQHHRGSATQAAAAPALNGLHVVPSHPRSPARQGSLRSPSSRTDLPAAQHPDGTAPALSPSADPLRGAASGSLPAHLGAWSEQRGSSSGVPYSASPCPPDPAQPAHAPAGGVPAGPLHVAHLQAGVLSSASGLPPSPEQLAAEAAFAANGGQYVFRQVGRSALSAAAEAGVLTHGSIGASGAPADGAAGDGSGAQSAAAVALAAAEAHLAREGCELVSNTGHQRLAAQVGVRTVVAAAKQGSRVSQQGQGGDAGMEEDGGGESTLAWRMVVRYYRRRVLSSTFHSWRHACDMAARRRAEAALREQQHVREVLRRAFAGWSTLVQKQKWYKLVGQRMMIKRVHAAFHEWRRLSGAAAGRYRLWLLQQLHQAVPEAVSERGVEMIELLRTQQEEFDRHMEEREEAREAAQARARTDAAAEGVGGSGGEGMQLWDKVTGGLLPPPTQERLPQQRRSASEEGGSRAASGDGATEAEAEGEPGQQHQEQLEGEVEYEEQQGDPGVISRVASASGAGGMTEARHGDAAFAENGAAVAGYSQGEATEEGWGGEQGTALDDAWQDGEGPHAAAVAEEGDGEVEEGGQEMQELGPCGSGVSGQGGAPLGQDEQPSARQSMGQEGSYTE